jgi:hypothetical protein
MFRALRAASVTLQSVLEASFGLDPDLVLANATSVYLGTPDEMKIAGQSGLSLWLYRLIRDEQTLNLPPRRPAPNRIRRQPLPVRLHYLMTPIFSTTGVGEVPQTEQDILGRVLQTFIDKPMISGGDLADAYRGTGLELTVRLETLALDELSRVWDSLDHAFRLCVSYEVSVVTIDSMREDQSGTPVGVVLPDYGIGAPEAAP